MYQFNPSPAELSMLWLIRERESGQNYQAQNPRSTAEGAYQDIKTTWEWLCSLTGVDVQRYPTARSAPPEIQDLNNLLLLRRYGPNSSKSWKASGPYPAFQEVRGMLQAAGIQNP